MAFLKMTVLTSLWANAEEPCRCIMQYLSINSRM